MKSLKKFSALLIATLLTCSACEPASESESEITELPNGQGFVTQCQDEQEGFACYLDQKSAEKRYIFASGKCNIGFINPEGGIYSCSSCEDGICKDKKLIEPGDDFKLPSNKKIVSFCDGKTTYNINAEFSDESGTIFGVSKFDCPESCIIEEGVAHCKYEKFEEGIACDPNDKKYRTSFCDEDRIVRCEMEKRAFSASKCDLGCGKFYSDLFGVSSGCRSNDCKLGEEKKTCFEDPILGAWYYNTQKCVEVKAADGSASSFEFGWPEDDKKYCGVGSSCVSGVGDSAGCVKLHEEEGKACGSNYKERCDGDIALTCLNNTVVANRCLEGTTCEVIALDRATMEESTKATATCMSPATECTDKTDVKNVCRAIVPGADLGIEALSEVKCIDSQSSDRKYFAVVSTKDCPNGCDPNKLVCK